MRDWLLEELERFRAFDEREAAMVYRMIDFLNSDARPFDRTWPEGHVTASAWVTDMTHKYALLTHHHRLDRWLQLGGHLEGDDTLLDAAMREAREESGLTSVQPLHQGVWDVDIHLIPKPDHLHYDVRFLLEADRREPLRITSESKDLAWVLVADVPQLNSEPSIARMVKKHKRDFGQS